MATNDTVDLIFDRPDTVAWETAGVMVSALEELMSRATLAVSNIKRSTAIHSMSPKFAPPRAALAAPIRAGSLVVPLIFLAGEAQEYFAQAVMGGRPDGEVPAWWDLLGAATNGAVLLELLRECVFGRGGILRREDGIVEPLALEPRERAVADLGLVLSPEGGNWLKELMDTADKTGCGSVRIRYRDELDIELVRPDRPYSNRRLGQGKRRSEKAETVTVTFSRTSDAIWVSYEGNHRPLFLAVEKPATTLLILGRSDADVVPKSGEYDARCVELSRDQLTPVDAVPSEFESATTIYRIIKLRDAAFH